ncbi:putative ubiquinone biosynthesis monooxygenase [Tulasnella sp. 418]|nr:putative ubiquinone biosynthesis monooxygenase [Tulasnella sp. 418]
MQVWDGISDARIYFSAREFQESGPSSSTRPYMATMTENLSIQRALLRLLDRYPQVKLLDNIKVDDILPDSNERGGWPLVKLSDGRTLRARLLIGADGFNSPVKKYAGIQTYGWAYDTHAVVATLHHSPMYPNMPFTAYQRFLPTGPIAFLPLSETSASLVWSTRPHLAKTLKQLEPDAFRRMVNAAFRLPTLSMQYLHDILSQDNDMKAEQIAEEIRWREESHNISPHSNLSSSHEDLQGVGGAGVGGYSGEADMPPLVTSVQPGSIASFPLRMSHAEEYLGTGLRSRTVLVGDAAHTVHPLAGQGLNMGLADVNSLAKCIRDAVSVGADIGSRTALLPYPATRYFENHKLLSATDKLHKIYSTENAPLVWARSVGLEVINELPFVKGLLMTNAGSTSAKSERTAGDDVLDVAANVIEVAARTAATGSSIMHALATARGNTLRNAMRR